MPAAPVFMLRTVASDGSLEQFLPDFAGIDMSPVYCDAGTVVFSYPVKGANFNLLGIEKELAVMMNGVEIPDLRCKIETIELDNADDAEDGALWKYTCRTMAGQLEYTIIYPQNYIFWARKVIGKAKPISYTNKTVGYILNDLFSRAQSRTAMAGFTWDFTATHDSEGNAWNGQLTITPDMGKSYLSLMKDLVSQGSCEFNVVKRLIRVFKPDLMGIDRTVGSNPLVFRKGRDIKDAPRKMDTRGLFTTGLFGNSDNTAFAEVDDTVAIATYGRREGFNNDADISWKNNITESWLEIRGNFWLSRNKKPAVEVTHGLHFETEDQPRPITNFNIGDWAYTDVGQGLERFRILQWVASAAADGTVTGSLTMGWLFNTQLSQVKSAIAQITNGSVNAGSAPKNDGVTPATVTGVIPTSASYFVNNIPRSNLTVSWTAVTENEDGSDITDLDYYQVQWKYSTDIDWRATQRVESDSTIVTFVNLDPGATAQVRVRAVDMWSNNGDWSTTAPVTLAGDTIAPLKPASPVVTSNVGTLRVVWSGLDYQGNPMPVDLAGVEVHVSTSDFTPSAGTKKDVLPPQVLSTTLTQGLTYGQEYWVKLIAFDTTGNKSVASDTTATSHTVLKQVVNTEIGSGEVGLGQVRFSDVGNLIDDGTFENFDVRAIRAVLMAGTHMSFDNTTASNGNWSFKITGQNPWTTEELLLQAGVPVKPGERVFGAADYKCSTDSDANAIISLIVRWKDKDGNLLNDAGAISSSAIAWYALATNFNLVARNNTWHARVTSTSRVAPPNAVTFDIGIRGMTHPSGTVWMDAVEVRKQVDTLLIGDAAITSAKIANLAVNNAHIANVSAGKITVGSLIADITVAARIKTADTGARVELNSGGIGAWNTGGTQTLSVAGADGSITMIGQLKSGTSGKRIEINPTATLLPEIRWYANNGTDFGYINAASSGSDVNLGMNSSAYDDAGVQVISRSYLNTAVAELAVVRADSQARRGGYVWAGPGNLFAGYHRAGTDGGYIYTDGGVGRFGWNPNNSASGQYMSFASGRTLHVGKWANFVAASSNDGIFTGNVVGDASVTSISILYGPTMDSTMTPITDVDDNIVHSSALTDTTNSGFTLTISPAASGGWRCNFWVFRV